MAFWRLVHMSDLVRSTDHVVEEPSSGDAVREWLLQDRPLDAADPTWVPCDSGLIGPDGVAVRVLDPARVCLKRHGGWLPHASLAVERVVAPLLARAGVTEFRLPEEHQEALLYSVGGVFEAHVDRRLGLDHMGTLLLVAPSADLQGGVLYSMEADGPRRFVAVGPGDGGEPYAAFVPLGVPHRVSEVTRGSRVVGKAAVFGKKLGTGEFPPARMRRMD
jgi:hypothetical protein